MKIHPRVVHTPADHSHDAGWTILLDDQTGDTFGGVHYVREDAVAQMAAARRYSNTAQYARSRAAYLAALAAVR